MHFSLVLGDYLLSLVTQDRRPKFSCLPPDSLLLIAAVPFPRTNTPFETILRRSLMFGLRLPAPDKANLEVRVKLLVPKILSYLHQENLIFLSWPLQNFMPNHLRISYGAKVSLL